MDIRERLKKKLTGEIDAEEDFRKYQQRVITERKEQEKAKQEIINNEIKKQVNNINSNFIKSNPQTVTLPMTNNAKSSQKNTILPTNVRLATEEEKEIEQKYNINKTPLDKALYVGKSTGAGLVTGTAGIAQAGITDVANNLNKGSKSDKNILELTSDFGNSLNGILNPVVPFNNMINKIPERISNYISTIADKDKSIIEKIGSLITDTSSEALNNTVPKNIINTGTQLVGKILPTAGSEAMKLNNVIAEPINEMNQTIAEEGQYYDKVTQTAGQVGQVVGNMLPSIGVTAITKNPTMGLATMGISVKGQATQEALNKGAELDEAVKIGDTKAMIEVGTEMLTGGVNIFGKGALDDLVERGINSKVKNQVLNYLAKQGVGISGEILEEVISDTLGTVIDKGTVDPDANYTWEDFGDTAITTILSTIVLNALGGGYTKNAYNQNIEEMQAYNIQQKLQEAQDIINNVQNQQGQANNTINTQTQRIMQEENKVAQNKSSSELDSILNNKDLPMQSYQYEKSDNVKINNLRQDANKYFNNSEKAKNYVKMLEKIILDKNIEIRLDGNLKTADGRIANGSYSNGAITINPNSTRAGEFIAIHELTHAIGTKEMLKMIKTYRQSNTEFDTAVKGLLENYKETEISEEALADIAGQLFGNQEFINNIAQNNPNIFQKLYSEIKYLWHQFRGYKNQDQFIEDLYYKWTQAYNNNTTNSKKSSYSIQADGNGNKYVKVDTDQDIFDGINENDYNKIAKMYMQDYLKGNTILNKNDKATIGSKGINKYTNPTQQTKYLSEKMQLTPELKNVLEIAEKVEDSPPTKDTSKYPNWEYYKFKFELGGKNFEGLINIGVDKNGNKHFYEINKIHTTSSSYVSTNKSSSMDSINNSIAPTKNDVNTTTKYSIQESENNSGSFNLQKNRFDVSGNENLVNAKTLFYRTREDGLYYVQATDGSGKITYDGVFYGEKQLARSLGDEIASKIVNTSENTNNEIYLQSDSVKNETDYMMAHRPTETGAYASNITKGTGEWESLMPEDVYEHPEWYFDMNQEYSKESFKILKQIKNNPNAEITIYRATTGNKINKGDWVTLSKKYAEYHNNSQFNGKGNIVELKVKAKDVQYAGDDINEFGYFPQVNTQTTDNPDIRYSQNNQTWQQYLDKNYKSTGTRTSMQDILPTASQNAKDTVLPTLNKTMQDAGAPKNTAQEQNISYNLPIDEKTKSRKHYKSIVQSQYITDEAKKIAKDLMKTDTYVPESNNKQLERADRRIELAGADSELESLLSRAMTGGNIKADDIAVGERLIQYYSKTGNKAKLQDAIQATAMAGTTAGQTVQALSLLNHQTPEGQAVWLQRSVEKMNNDLKRTRGEKAEQFNLTPEMTEKIVNSKNNEELQNNLNDVYKELGQQVTKTIWQKIDSWRYFAMLANPRTHIRNIVGNVSMAGVQTVKNKIAGGIEAVVNKFNPEMERTHTIIPASEEIKQFAKNDIKNVSDRLGLSQNKYNPKTRLENSMKTFKTDALEKTIGRAYKINDNALETEDGVGLKHGYVKALSEYMTANKLTPEHITDKQLSKARNYAVEQARQATFHQDARLASLLNQLSNKNKFSKFMLDAIVPYKKTPINIAKEGMNYSPVGLVYHATMDIKKVRNGEITVNQYIDNVSKGLTGTGIALVGYALASAGILSASGSDDEDKQQYEEALGNQTYSIKIGDNTYSLDWIAPSGIPLFIGAETYEIMQQQKEIKTSSTDDETAYNQAINSAVNILDAFTNAMNPMTEMSMLSGLSSALKSYEQGASKTLAGVGINATKSYINQFIPTALRQIAKTTDEYERTTTSTKTGTLPKAVDSTKNYIMSSIPGLRQLLPIKTDIWGNQVKQSENVVQRALENSVFPWTRKEITTTKVDNEIISVYNNTGESSVLPDNINKNLTINKQKYLMTSEEYAKYQKEYGKNSYNLLNKLVNSTQYKKLKDSQKQIAIEKVYEYAKEQIKIDYAKNNNLNYEESRLSETLNALKKSNANTSNYLEYIALTKDMDKTSEKITVLASSDFTDKTKQVIYENYIKSENDSQYGAVKASGMNITEYLKFKTQEFESDKKDDGTLTGQTVSNSKKKKIVEYLNSMKITGNQRLLLYAMQGYTTTASQKTQLANYVQGLDLSKKEKLKLYDKFSGFTVYKNGTVKW